MGIGVGIGGNGIDVGCRRHRADADLESDHLFRSRQLAFAVTLGRAWSQLARSGLLAR
jgi:hypothetical protein